MADRKYYKYDNVCSSCLNYLIQNDPGKIAINQANSKALWCDASYRRKCLKAFELHNKNMQLNTAYAHKHRRRSRSVEGFIEINGQSIRFDSAFELIFLWQVRNKYQKIRRCNFAIAYSSHFYHPDFLVIGPDGYKSIIEIKGFYKSNISEKQEAAEKYIAETGIADSYILYDTELLLSEGILRGVGGAHMWKQIREINNETTVTFTSEEHKRIAEIGRSRFRRETKNKKDIKTTI
jgi:hypothetical protein